MKYSTPAALRNVRHILKAIRAKRRAASNKAADERDAAHMAISARARRDGLRPVDHATGYATADDHTFAVLS